MEKWERNLWGSYWSLNLLESGITRDWSLLRIGIWSCWRIVFDMEYELLENWS